MEENYVLKEVFDERLKRVDDENERQNHRLSLVEKNGEALNELVISVKELAMSVKQMQEELKRQGERLAKIEEEPGEKWKKFTWLIVSGLVGLVIGYLSSHLGI